MASSIKIKRSETAGNPSVLGAGELAYSALPDNGSNGGDRLYIGSGIETSGNAVNHIVIGGKFFTDAITAATNAATGLTLVKRDSSGNFSGNIISATTFSGTLSGVANTALGWTTARDLSLTGDATATISSVDGTASVSAPITLATVNSNVGTYGSATAIPVITVNAKGLVTSVTTAPISSSLTIVGNLGSDVIRVGTDNLTFAGGTGVSTLVTDNTVTFAIGQNVATTSNVTFNDVTVNGVLYSNDITATSVNVAGDAVITGNLTVQGTTTTINSTVIAVSDLNLVVAKDAANATAANGAGLTVNGAGATLTYSSVDDRWNFNKNLNVTTVYGSLNGNATTATTWQIARTLALTGDATASFIGVSGSADLSTSITLATVNANVGSFGSGTSVPNFTVNAKGLITAAGATAIATASTSVLGLASFNATQFSVSSGAVTLSVVDGGTY